MIAHQNRLQHFPALILNSIPLISRDSAFRTGSLIGSHRFRYSGIQPAVDDL
jgi:hypothetical protein